MKKDRTRLLLYEPNLYKAFLILAAPVFLANFMKAFNDLVDTYFIGHIENSVAAQAGISISWPPINILTSFQAGLSVAGVAVISQLLGSGQKERARSNAGMLLVVSLLCGALLNLTLYAIAPGVVRLMGAEGAVYESSLAYLRIRSFEMIAGFIFSAFQAIRQAQGDTVTPVVLSMTAVVINIILTGIFVRGFGLGAYGAGLATLLGQASIAPVCLWLLFSKRQALHLDRHAMRVKWQPLLSMVRIATPAACSQALSSLGFLVLQSVVLSYGDSVSAAFSIGNKISSILLMPVVAMGSVLAAYVGQNIGAGNSERARAAYRVSRNSAFCIAVVGSILLFPVRFQLVALLTNDPHTQMVGMEYVLWVLLTQPLMAMFQNYMGVFNGSGKTSYAFWIASSRLWVIRLPIILMFRWFTDFGRRGIWYAMVISNFLILIPAAFLLHRLDFTPYQGIDQTSERCQAQRRAAG